MSNKSSKDKKKELFKTITYVVFFIVFLVAGGNYFLPLGGAGVLLWMMLTVIGLFLLISWHAKSSVYKCLECGNTFSISIFKDFLSLYRPGSGEMRYLRCPMCRRSSREKVKKNI